MIHHTTLFYAKLRSWDFKNISFLYPLSLFLYLKQQDMISVRVKFVFVFLHIFHICSCFLCWHRKRKMEKLWALFHLPKTNLSSLGSDQDRNMRSPSTLWRTTPEDPKHLELSPPVSFEPICNHTMSTGL